MVIADGKAAALVKTVFFLMEIEKKQRSGKIVLQGKAQRFGSLRYMEFHSFGGYSQQLCYFFMGLVFITAHDEDMPCPLGQGGECLVHELLYFAGKDFIGLKLLQ